jgi:hypothetical protein
VPLALVLALSGAGCHAFVKTATPTTQAATQQDVIKAANLLNQAGVVAAGVQSIEIALYDQGVIKPVDHKVIQTGFLNVGVAVQAALTAMQDVSATPTERKAAVDRILTAVDGMLAQGVPTILDPTKQAQVRAGILAVRGVLAVVLTLLG